MSAIVSLSRLLSIRSISDIHRSNGMFLLSFLPGFRCSGQKHCRYDAAIDHPGAGAWLPGGISLKYACIPGESDFRESFVLNLRDFYLAASCRGSIATSIVGSVLPYPIFLERCVRSRGGCGQQEGPVIPGVSRAARVPRRKGRQVPRGIAPISPSLVIYRPIISGKSRGIWSTVSQMT